MRSAAIAFAGLLLLAGGALAQNCVVQQSDGSTCSQNPCTWCTGKAAGVYADPGQLGKTYYDCYTPSGAECLACRPGENDAQCPTVTSSVPSGAPTPGPALAPSSGTCSVQPGDGSTCSASPCTFCAGKAAGVYADAASGCSTYFDCAGTSAECLKCYGSYGAGTQCPGSGSSCVASPSTPATPATTSPTTPATTTPASPSTSGCTVQPGDGSTCSQSPCTACAGKAAGVYPDTGSGCGQTYYSCSPTSAECLKCYSSGYTSQCPAASSCRA